MRCSNKALKGLIELTGVYGEEPPNNGIAAALLDLRDAREIVLKLLACDECKNVGLCRRHRGKLGRIAWEYQPKAAVDT